MISLKDLSGAEGMMMEIVLRVGGFAADGLFGRSLAGFVFNGGFCDVFGLGREAKSFCVNGVRAGVMRGGFAFCGFGFFLMEEGPDK